MSTSSTTSKCPRRIDGAVQFRRHILITLLPVSFAGTGATGVDSRKEWSRVWQTFLEGDVTEEGYLFS